MAKPKIGDIIEIKASTGLLYAQYTHYHPYYTTLIRVFSKAYETRPSNFSEVIQKPVMKDVFFAFSSKPNKNNFPIVSNEIVTEKLMEFPFYQVNENKVCSYINEQLKEVHLIFHAYNFIELIENELFSIRNNDNLIDINAFTNTFTTDYLDTVDVE